MEAKHTSHQSVAVPEADRQQWSIKRTAEHAVFWALVLVLFAAYFGIRQDVYGQSLFFVGLMLPITMATTYTVVYWLVPTYLMQGRVGRFALYLSYCVLGSMYLELCVIVGLYMTVADYQALFLEPDLPNLLDVLLGMYAVVFAAASVHTARRWQRERTRSELLRTAASEAYQALEESRLAQETVIELRIDRETVRLPANEIAWVESQRDYVLLATRSGQRMTKLTLNKLESMLEGAGFVRIHRSYLVRRDAVTSWTADNVRIGDRQFPVGRSYRKQVQQSMTD